MSTLPRVVISAGSLIGAATIAAVQVPPETATSNLAAWAKTFGFNGVALALPPGIDRWAAAFGLAVAVTAFLVGIDLARAMAGKAPPRKRRSRAR